MINGEKSKRLECLALVAFLVVVAAVVVAVTVPQFPLHRDLALQVPACYYCDFFLVLGHDMRFNQLELFMALGVQDYYTQY